MVMLSLSFCSIWLCLGLTFCNNVCVFFSLSLSFLRGLQENNGCSQVDYNHKSTKIRYCLDSCKRFCQRMQCTNHSTLILKFNSIVGAAHHSQYLLAKMFKCSFFFSLHFVSLNLSDQFIYFYRGAFKFFFCIRIYCHSLMSF